MRNTLIVLATVAGFSGTPALQAQHQLADSTRAGQHMAMMMQHHSVATVDLLVSHRDSLQLTEDQLKKLADLREHFAQAGGHAMHGEHAGTGTMMNCGMEMGKGMAMEHRMTGRAHIAFDRVPSKMVPRVRRSAAHNCPMCPFAILTAIQRERAHQLLNHHQGHPHQG